MKKRVSMIAAALTSAIVLTMSVPASPAMAASTTQQQVVVEDGVTVVYITTYVDADEFIGEQTTTWYDANGTKYVNTIKQRPAQTTPEIASKVTWSDANGNTFVLDNTTNTVTVYDADGNVIAVRPAN